MTSLTVEIPEAVRKQIEAIGTTEGFTVSQFLASAAGEKLAVWLTMDYLRDEARAGRREDFERFMNAVPQVPPVDGDEIE